jgi:hypothetical protein
MAVTAQQNKKAVTYVRYLKGLIPRRGRLTPLLSGGPAAITAKSY